MEPKYKIDDRLFFFWRGKILEGIVKCINISIHRYLGERILYTVETTEGVKRLDENILFKSKLKCAKDSLAYRMGSVEGVLNGEELFRIISQGEKEGKEAFNGEG